MKLLVGLVLLGSLSAFAKENAFPVPCEIVNEGSNEDATSQIIGYSFSASGEILTNALATYMGLDAEQRSAVRITRLIDIGVCARN